MPRDGQVFAKIGDSITVAPDFLTCFAGSAISLGSHDEIAPTIAQFRAGNAAGASPFNRVSLAAKGGITASYVTYGSPCPLEREIDAIDARIGIVMFGTNEVRFGWSVDDFGAGLWNVVDEALADGTIPIMSSIPPINGDPGADARIPTFNRVARAIAQGRGVPLVDLHSDVASLPNRGLASDGIHLSVTAQGGCDLTDAGLQGGYNVRNLVTLEALARTAAALQGTASDATALVREGTGTVADPWLGELPLIDLGDTRSGSSEIATYGCGGRMLSGHEVIYRLELAVATPLAAYIVDRPGTDVDVQILAGSVTAAACVSSGDQIAQATVGPGSVYVVVDGPEPTSDGEYLLVVQRR